MDIADLVKIARRIGLYVKTRRIFDDDKDKTSAVAGRDDAYTSVRPIR